MDCNQFEAKVNRILDERQDPNHDLELMSHVRKCIDCKEELKIYSQFADLKPAIIDSESLIHSTGINSGINQSKMNQGDVSSANPICGQMNRKRMSRKKLIGYVAYGVTAAVLLVLLTPINAFLFEPKSTRSNVAQAENVFTDSGTNSVSASSKLKRQPDSNSATSNQDGPNLVGRVEANIADVNARFSQLQQVGQSINSVWKTLKDDEFLIPIIKQGALMWVRGT